MEFMLYSAILFFVNLVIAGILSRNDNFFKNTENLLTGEFNHYFKKVINKTDHKYFLRENNKYRLEFFLFIFVIIGFLVMNVAISYLLVMLVMGNENELIENLFKSIFAEFIFIIATALIINKFKETILNYKKIQSGNFYHSHLTNNEIYFPFMTLEGSIASELAKTDNIYLAVPYNEITEFLVEPSRRVSSVRGFTYTPPYYKIFLQDKKMPIYVMRMYYKGQEKQFLNEVSSRIKCLITYNDQLD